MYFNAIIVIHISLLTHSDHSTGHWCDLRVTYAA